MKITINLMHRDRAFDPDAKKCVGYGHLNADFELTHVVNAMARMDGVIESVCRAALFTPLTTEDEIEFRRTVLLDARRNAPAIRRLYEILLHMDDVIRDKTYFTEVTAISLYRVNRFLVELYIDYLEKLRVAAERDCAGYTSEPLRNLYSMLQTELSEEYIESLRDCLATLPEHSEIAVTAGLNADFDGISYEIDKKVEGANKIRWQMAQSYVLVESSDNVTEAIKAWDARRNRVINDLAVVMKTASQYMGTFFAMIRRELAFYVGCLNLEEKLRELGAPICFPTLCPQKSRGREYRGV